MSGTGVKQTLRTEHPVMYVPDVPTGLFQLEHIAGHPLLFSGSRCDVTACVDLGLSPPWFRHSQPESAALQPGGGKAS